MHNELNILFIEDIENDSFLMSHYLKELCKDIQYTRVETKEELTSVLEKKVYDIIIIDNALPQLTAFEAIKIIKEMGIIKPMICVSGSEMLDVKKQCIEAGAIDFILKSDKEKIVEVVKNLLQKNPI